MKTSSELRAEARKSLSLKLGEALLVILIYWGVTVALNSVASFIPFASLLLIIVTIPFSYGLTVSFIKLKRNENFSYGDMFTESYRNFSKIWSVAGNICLKLLVPIILFAISTILYIGSVFILPLLAPLASSFDENAVTIIIFCVSILSYMLILALYTTAMILLLIKGYYYSLAFYLLYDNPNMSGKEIVALSESIMTGQRAKMFFLDLSFIGWALLATLTCGIGFLFLMPYMQFAKVNFYEDRAGITTNANGTN